MEYCGTYTERPRVEDITDNSTVLSRSFSALKWILALFVAGEHYFKSAIVNLPDRQCDLSEFTAYSAFIDTLQSFFINYSVPVFFFMSGYLSYKALSPGTADYRRWLTRRLRRLLVPFVIWMLVALAYYIVYDLYNHYFKGLDMQFVDAYFCSGYHGIAAFAGDFFGLRTYFTEFNVPLWYMRDLMMALIVIPPAVFYVDKYLGKRAVALMAIALLVCFMCFFDDHSPYRFVVAGFFFTAGFILRMYKVNFPALYRYILPASLVAYIALGLLHNSLYIEYPAEARLIKTVNICAFTCLMLSSVYFMVKGGLLKGGTFLVGASFFIYVVHFPYASAARAIAVKIINPQTDSALITLGMAGFYILFILAQLSLYALTRRCAPEFAGRLMGGR